MDILYGKRFSKDIDAILHEKKVKQRLLELFTRYCFKHSSLFTRLPRGIDASHSAAYSTGVTRHYFLVLSY